MAVEEWDVSDLSNLGGAEGDLRDQMVEHLMHFREQIDHLETCYDLDPYE